MQALPRLHSCSSEKIILEAQVPAGQSLAGGHGPYRAPLHCTVARLPPPLPSFHVLPLWTSAGMHFSAEPGGGDGAGSGAAGQPALALLAHNQQGAQVSSQPCWPACLPSAVRPPPARHPSAPAACCYGGGRVCPRPGRPAQQRPLSGRAPALNAHLVLCRAPLNAPSQSPDCSPRARPAASQHAPSQV